MRKARRAGCVQSLLSGRRTALVTPWDVKARPARPRFAVRDDDSESARAVANVEAGRHRQRAYLRWRWCRVSIDRFRGYVLQKQLWGVYENEIVQVGRELLRLRIPADQPHDDVDMADSHALRRLRQAVDPDGVARNVHQLAVALR